MSWCFVTSKTLDSNRSKARAYSLFSFCLFQASFFEVFEWTRVLWRTFVALWCFVLAYIVHRIFLDIFHFYLHTVIITNYRIVEVDRSVLFKDSKTSIDLTNVQDIQKRQSGLMETLLITDRL